MNRFHSENWSTYLTIIGAAIGFVIYISSLVNNILTSKMNRWTRGTGLMSVSNFVAEGIESLGARTFSTQEMAFNLVGLLHPTIIKHSYSESVWADLNGGLGAVHELKTFTSKLRGELLETSEVRRAILKENTLDDKVAHGASEESELTVHPKSNMKFSFPDLPKNQKLTHLRGMIDLEKTVVVTGFGEVGPWGSSRTRWEMESYGVFSLEGCIEMAWLMGLIKFHNGPLKKVQSYNGWIDVETQEPVADHEIKAKYEERILKHAGIRLIGNTHFLYNLYSTR
jgi:fatty acid synthase subunit alpha, fungi type